MRDRAGFAREPDTVVVVDTSDVPPAGVGLAQTDAVARRRVHGPNVFTPPDPFAALKAFLRPLADPMAILLAAAAAVHYALGEFDDGHLLVAAIVPIVAVDVVLEARSRRALARLSAAVAPTSRVVRDGAVREVATEDVVPGDLLLLAEGDVVRADGVLETASNLSLDESLLTGEAEPVAKRSPQTPRSDRGPPRDAPAAESVAAGSTVLAGQCTVRVLTTGPSTRLGRIGTLVARTDSTATPLQRKVRALVRRLAAVTLAVALGLFLLELSRGRSAAGAFLTSVALAMSAFPEEFPLVLTLFSTMGAWRLSRHGVLVRRLAAVETLGSTTCICLDKTGTLTEARFDLEIHAPVSPAGADAGVLEAAVLASEPAPADPLERSIEAHAREHGVDVDALRATWNLAFDHDFDRHGRHMSHVWRSETLGERVVAKGAVEGILEHCRIEPAARARVLEAVDAAASRGMRVLALAQRVTPPGGPRSRGVREEDEQDLELVGLLGFHDPVRAAAPAAVAQCRAAGVRLKLVTGDHAGTARAVAQSVGLVDGTPRVATGADLDAAGPDFARVVREADVLARVRPEQKHAIVAALRDAGEVVAMTGDGMNDAPAMRRADIAVSMGARAADVARESAALVLLEDDFTTFVAAVREGRTIAENIRRAFHYLVGFHVPIVVLALVPPLLGWPSLLLPSHLVWLELVVHPVSALVFENARLPFDPMTRPPRPPSAPLLERADVLRSAATGAAVSAAALLAYALRLPSGTESARAVALIVVIVGSVLLVLAERAGTRRWTALSGSVTRRDVVVLGLVLASVPLIVETPAIAHALGLAPLALADFALGLLLAFASTVWRAWGSRATRASDAAT